MMNLPLILHIIDTPASGSKSGTDRQKKGVFALRTVHRPGHRVHTSPFHVPWQGAAPCRALWSSEDTPAAQHSLLVFFFPKEQLIKSLSTGDVFPPHLHSDRQIQTLETETHPALLPSATSISHSAWAHVPKFPCRNNSQTLPSASASPCRGDAASRNLLWDTLPLPPPITVPTPKQGEQKHSPSAGKAH